MGDVKRTCRESGDDKTAVCRVSRVWLVLGAQPPVACTARNDEHWISRTLAPSLKRACVLV